MNPQSYNEEAVFNEARRIEFPDNRAQFLRQACPDDSSVARIDALLRVHECDDSFLTAPLVGLDPSEIQPVTESPGTIIGPYKLLEQIGEGGFGVVFMAEQTAPVKRKVALKVIKPGMDTREVIARFEAERQALALMDHPNIAKVLDVGTTGDVGRRQEPDVDRCQPVLSLASGSRLLTPDAGRPYFVMELVRGIPITEYCDKHQVTPKRRLDLFVTVCQAVQHAHQKGIIHRDIKPSNVLVTHHDETAVVKVIDFGIAKAMSGQLTDKTLFTGFAQMIGTPLYMSPEQAEMSGLGVDTRTDIYGLGVLLYELLTGTTPFDRDAFQTAGFDDIRRIIREQEPAPPSARISTLARSTTVSTNRRSDPQALRKQCRGELDWIVMKCLEKDRNRRYETASAVAADVKRYLDDEPVLACPPSAMYRFHKFARRNLRAFAVATAAVLVALLGVATLAVSNMLIRQEQTRTKDERVRAQQALLLAERRAEEVRQGLERLQAANAWLERGRWHASLKRWDDADAAFTRAVALHPHHVAAWIERGDLFTLLGLWDLANEDFTREFELREPIAVDRWLKHALLRLSVGDEAGYRQVRDRMRERFRGTRSIHFALEVMRTCALGSDSESDPEPFLDLAQRAVDQHPGAWFPQYVLGVAELRAGQHEKAVSRLRASLTAEPVGPNRALIYPILAMAYYRRGQMVEAREALEAAGDAIDHWMQQMYGTEQQRWAIHQGATGDWPIAWWDWLECQLFYREAKLLVDGAPPAEDPRRLVLRARAFAGLRRNSTAETEYAAALKLWPDDPQVRLEFHRCAGYSAIRRRQWGEAAAEFSKSSELTPDDAGLWKFRAIALLGTGDEAGYRKTCRAAFERFEKTAEFAVADDIITACVLRDDALPDMARLVPLARVASAYLDKSGAALYRAGRYDESLQCFDARGRTCHPRPWDWIFQAMAHHRLGHADEAARCLAEAAQWIDEANHQTEDDLNDTLAAWGPWYEPVVVTVLLREAKELLNLQVEMKDSEPEITSHAEPTPGS